RSWAGSTATPMPLGGAPLTSTRPSRIQPSASRREPPAPRARNWLSRTLGAHRFLDWGLGTRGRLGVTRRGLGSEEIRALDGARRRRVFQLAVHALPFLEDAPQLLQLREIRKLVDPHVRE